MKSFRRSLLVALALSASACNMDPDFDTLESGQPASQAQAQSSTEPLPNSCPSSIPPPPAQLPTAPTPLSRIPLGTPLYPTGPGTRSAHTVIVTDPADPKGAFLAFGFDVRANRLQFYVSGQNGRELRRMLTQLAVDIDNLEQDQGTDTGFTWGMSGQVGGPIIPQPGVYEGSWKTAFNNAYQTAGMF